MTEPAASEPSRDGAATPTPDGPGPDAVSEAVDELTACIAYSVASCERNDECWGYESDCSVVTLNCPDQVFSEGSTRTPETMMKCAEELRTFPCDSWVNGERPDCITPGTAQSGEPCAFGSQCATLWCSSAYTGECGVCMFEAGAGDDCTDERYFCPLGTACNEDATGCEAVERIELPAPLPVEGERCEPGLQCAPELRCAGEEGARVCVPYPAAGEGCVETQRCRQGAYCQFTNGTCLELPALGEACGVDARTETATWCAVGATCERVAKNLGTCIALPEAGEPCFFNADDVESSGRCAQGAVCDAALSPPTCELRFSPPGTPCSNPYDCETSACLCEDDSCATRRCLWALDVGDRCPELDSACHPGTTCVDGQCQALRSQRLFAALCSP